VGDFVVEVQRQWAPNGADRFYNLVDNGFYDGVAFFRVVERVVAQFGIHGDSIVSAQWRDSFIPDDPVLLKNTRGTLSFATAGAPDSRDTQVFINLRDNEELDGLGFAAFGRVLDGMGVVRRLYSGYGDGPPNGNGPSQDRLQLKGNRYLRLDFPNLDYVERATIVEVSPILITANPVASPGRPPSARPWPEAS
jgi:peptidyl-prolyl cis-trans isomerase A (cyclophilin A)